MKKRVSGIWSIRLKALTNKKISGVIIRYISLFVCAFISTTLVAKENVYQFWEIETQYKNVNSNILKARELGKHSNQDNIKKGDLLNLPISSTASYLATINKVIQNESSITYIAEIKDEYASRAVITVSNSQVFATFNSSKRLHQFHITDALKPLKVRSLVDKSIVKNMANDIFMPKPTFTGKIKEPSTIRPETGSNSLLQQKAPDTNEVAQLDLMAVYTNRMAEAYNGEPTTRIQHLVNLSNQIFEDSGVLIHINIVHSESVDYEVADVSLTMDKLLYNSFPFDGEIRDRRFEKRADLFVLFDIGLFTKSDGELVSGQASLPTKGDPTNKYDQLTVSLVSANSNDTVFIHEIGHNLGLQHSRKQTISDGPPPTFPYALGYGVDQEFTTIMAYPSAFGGALPLLKFSSPLNDCLGYNCGIDAEIDPINGADAVRALNEMRFAAQDALESSISASEISEFVNNTVGRCEVELPLDIEPYYTEQVNSIYCYDNNLEVYEYLKDNSFKYLKFFEYIGNESALDVDELTAGFGSYLSYFTLRNVLPTGLSSISKFPFLQGITIDGSQLSDDDIALMDLSQFEYLTDISIPNNLLTKIDFISNRKQVHNLDISNNGILSIAVLDSVEWHELNSSINLSYNPIEDISSLKFVKRVNDLWRLDISGLGITNENDILEYTPNQGVKNLIINDNELTKVPNLSTLLLVENSLSTLELRGNDIKNIHNDTWLIGLDWLDMANNNIYDITSILNFNGWFLNLNGNPVFCWQKNLIEEHFFELNEANENGASLSIDNDCSLDSDHDLMPDEWESNYGFDPHDPEDAQLDSDNDGYTNLEEFRNNTEPTDTDGDGVNDDNDEFPYDPAESVDTDGDGIGNNADTDDDGDGVEDSADAFPLDSTETLDTDLDGIGNNVDTDDDGDGVEDSADAYPLDSSRSSNSNTTNSSTSSISSGGGGSMYILLFLLFISSFIRLKYRVAINAT